MKLLPCLTLSIALLIAGCSTATDSSESPAWPELQYEPPALVEIEQGPLLVSSPAKPAGNWIDATPQAFNQAGLSATHAAGISLPIS